MTELREVIHNLQTTLYGEPWYGKSVMHVLDEVQAENAFYNLQNSSNSACKILFHLINWSEFTLSRIINDTGREISYYDEHDWTDPGIDIENWQTGLDQFKIINHLILEFLKTKESGFLAEQVPGRPYTIKFLLLGHIQHIVYHCGQIALLTRQVA